MLWTRNLHTIDVHAEGEIGRVLTSGVLDIAGNSIAEKLHNLNNGDQSLREFLTSEPRSNAVGSVVLLLPKCDPKADIGFIVLQPDQAHAMSGSNAICATTALIESGMVETQSPITTVTLDTAAGLVQARAEYSNGQCHKVTLDMPPAFAEDLDCIINSQNYGTLSVDIAFGGVFYAIISAEQIGLTITPDNARQLAEAGVALHQEIGAKMSLSHPEFPEIEGLAYVMFVEENNGFHRTCTTMRPGRLDRSPCGTGSNALLSTLFARGQLQSGDSYTTRSVIDSEFSLKIISNHEKHHRQMINAQVTGRGWVYGMSQLVLDPTDPYQQGFRLSDYGGTFNLAIPNGNPSQQILQFSIINPCLN